jgi:hypothetical protein
MVPTGARGMRAVGTNPICCIAPASGGDAFELDMATTTVPIGKIEVMDRLQVPLPLGWGWTVMGSHVRRRRKWARMVGSVRSVVTRRRPGASSHGLAAHPSPSHSTLSLTHSPTHPLTHSPTHPPTHSPSPPTVYPDHGRYKGYGLGMLVEILSSVLSGAAVGPNVVTCNTQRKQLLDLGHCFIALDPQRFAPGFDERLVAYPKQMRRLPGDVKTPGDPERAHAAEAALLGVTVHEKVMHPPGVTQRPHAQYCDRCVWVHSAHCGVCMVCVLQVGISLKALAMRLGVEVPRELSHLDTSGARTTLRSR